MGDSEKVDPMRRDRKRLPLDKPEEYYPIFLFYLLVVTPFWLLVLLPIFIASQVTSRIQRLFSKGSKKRKNSDAPAPKDIKEGITKGDIVCKSADKKDRVFDIVVFGATGFTGKMAATYLAKRYGKSIKWAIAGRRLDALETVRSEVLETNKMLKAEDIPILIADSASLSSLNAMVKQTVVIITTAGPFDKYGSLLVESCALHGTHYCDITGETDWVRKMIDQHDETARRSGARIVSFCGHDCVPWDLLTLQCANELRRRNKNETLQTMSFYDEINSAPSGGTMDTVFHSLTNRVKYTSALGFDPLMKKGATEGEGESGYKLTSKTQSFLGYSKEFKSWVGPFVMAMVMCNCVCRSNAVNAYGSKVTYKEAIVYPSFFSGYIEMVRMMIMGTCLFSPPLCYVMQNYFAPKPGSGPTEAAMDEGFLKVTGFAYGSSGTKLKTSLYFPTDPGYRDTARMLVESGLVLALEEATGDKIKVGGGVWTPAACQGEILLQRLLNTGCAYTMEEVK